MAKKQSKKPVKTKLRMLMDQEHEVNSCKKCKANVVAIKGTTTNCMLCGSADISKEIWV